MSLGPFDLTGEPFLALYIALFLATLVAGFGLRGAPSASPTWIIWPTSPAARGASATPW
jgi:hypothetical protein